MFGLFKRGRKPSEIEDAEAPAQQLQTFTADVQLNRLLLAAAAAGDAKKLDEYLRAGANASWRNSEAFFTVDPYLEHTALSLAAQNGHLRIVEILLRSMAKPDVKVAKGKTPLMLAAQKGHTDIARALLRAKADPKIRDERGSTACHYALRSGSARLAWELSRDAANATPLPRALRWAIESGTLPSVQMAVQLGANPNEPDEEGMMPLARIRHLFTAKKIDQTTAGSMASYLVGKGADMNRV